LLRRQSDRPRRHAVQLAAIRLLDHSVAGALASAINSQNAHGSLSAIGCRPLAFGSWLSAFNFRLSAVRSDICRAGLARSFDCNRVAFTASSILGHYMRTRERDLCLQRLRQMALFVGERRMKLLSTYPWRGQTHTRVGHLQPKADSL